MFNYTNVRKYETMFLVTIDNITHFFNCSLSYIYSIINEKFTKIRNDFRNNYIHI